MGHKLFKAVKSKGSVYVFKMDLDDYLATNTSYWCCVKGKLGKKYLKVSDGLFHRVVIGAKKGEIVDHKNRNTFDNTRENLRLCTYSENASNKELKNGLKGVHYNKQNKNWRVRVQKNRIITEVGSFNNIEDAKAAYNKAALEIHGEFASLNKLGE
jgi:hypothetical protein